MRVRDHVRRRAIEAIAGSARCGFSARSASRCGGSDDRDGARRVRRRRHAADPADPRSEHVLLLPRSPRQRAAVPAPRRHGTWDTNIERGIYWGMRLVEKDEEIRGPSANGRAFILLSDGQAWSGEVEKSIALAQGRGIPHPRDRRRHHRRRRHPRAGSLPRRGAAVVRPRSRFAVGDRDRRRRPLLRARSRARHARSRTSSSTPHARAHRSVRLLRVHGSFIAKRCSAAGGFLLLGVAFRAFRR